MKSIAIKHYAGKSRVGEAACTVAFALCLLLLGAAVAHLSVTEAQNQGMPMKMGTTEEKAQATNQKNDNHEVSIDNFSFTPMEMTIPAGSQVTWVNKDDVPHTVVSVDHQFKSKALDTDEKFSFTFPNPGTYEYFCSVHPKMTGKIIVK
jgi:plastocyanin